MNEFLTGANSKELLDINLAYGILAIKDLSTSTPMARD